MNVRVKEIPGFNGYLVYSDGRIYSKISGHFLKGEWARRYTKGSKGSGTVEHRVTLCKEGKTYRFLVHRIVAGVFIKSCKGFVVNHLDGNTKNNKVSNLEVTTAKLNYEHAVKHGLCCRGEKQHLCKNSTETARKVIEMIAKGYQQLEIHKATGMSIAAIKDIRRCKSWRWLSKGQLW